MNFTNSWDRIRGLALPVLLGLLPMVSLPFAADPWQPVRAGVLVLACLIGLRLGFQETRIPAAMLGLIGVGASFVITSALAGHPASSLFGVHGRFDGVVTALVLALVGAAGFTAGPRVVRTLGRAIGIAAPIVASVVVYQRLAGGPPTGLSGNAVLAGGWCAVAAAILVAAALGERGIVRVWLSAAALCAGVATVLTSSRGALLGLVLGLTVTALVVAKRGRWRMAVPAIVALVLLVVVAVSMAPSRFSVADAVGGSAGARLEIWKSTVRMVSDRPMLGTGPGRYLYVYPSYETARHAELEPGTRADQAHSVPLHAAATLGVPAALVGLLLLAVAFVSAATEARRGSIRGLVVLAGLGAWFGQALFGVSTVETDGLAWLLGGVAIAWWPHALTAISASTASGVLTRSLSPTAVGRMMRGAQALALLLVVACGAYIVSDIYFESGRAAYAAADFRRAHALALESVLIESTTDVRRVGVADAAGMLVATGASRDMALDAEKTVAAGLALEPGSYDLAYARARMLRGDGGSADRVLAAYLEAIRLYPFGEEAVLDATLWAASSRDANANGAIERAVAAARRGAR